jgi:hypothetical protein
MTFYQKAKSFLRSILVISASILIVFFVFRLAVAGSLTPPGAPAGTMHSLQEMYDSLVGTFDSSAVVANSNGDALQISKCIIAQITGGSCP